MSLCVHYEDVKGAENKNKLNIKSFVLFSSFKSTRDGLQTILDTGIDCEWREWK